MVPIEISSPHSYSSAIHTLCPSLIVWNQNTQRVRQTTDRQINRNRRQEKPTNCVTKAANVLANFSRQILMQIHCIFWCIGAFATTSQRQSSQSVAPSATVWLQVQCQVMTPQLDPLPSGGLGWT